MTYIVRVREAGMDCDTECKTRGKANTVYRQKAKLFGGFSYLESLMMLAKDESGERVVIPADYYGDPAKYHAA